MFLQQFPWQNDGEILSLALCAGAELLKSSNDDWLSSLCSVCVCVWAGRNN